MRARRTIRVLFVNDTARNGGPGRSLHAILRFLDPALVHRAVVLPRPGVIADLLSADHVADELHFVPGIVENPVEPWSRAIERRDLSAPAGWKALRLAGNVARAAGALARLSVLVRRGRFDLVYCNGTSADFAGGAVSAATGVPALWHVRYTSVPRAVSGLHRRLSAAEGVRRIVCVSRAAARLFAHCPQKVRTIHNGLDAAAFDPERARGRLRAALGLGEDVVVFGSHGRILRRKGYVEMVLAARLALDRLDAPARARLAFAVVGDTPQDFAPDHLEECRALAEGLGLGRRFHWLGFREDVRPWVGDFDVALVPSVYPDPLPRAVMESMALGKPVVAFDVGGVAEMISPGVDGDLVPFEPAQGEGGDGGAGGASGRSVAGLAEAILRYARDPELRRRHGAAARARALRDFDGRAHGRRIAAEIVAAVGARGEAPDGRVG